MFLRVHNDRGVERLYICRSVRIKTKIKSENVKSLGRIDKLMSDMNLSRDEVIAWGEAQVEKMNTAPLPVNVAFYPDKQIPMDEKRSFTAGYLFLQKIYYDLKMDNVFRNIKSRYKYEYDLDAIFSDLVYARVLEPGSKRASFETAQEFLEPPKYELHDVYRALSVLAKESDYIQSETYKNSNFVLKRNNHVLYYDCTNYYFEIEEEKNSQKYGKGKDHKPNPIVQMGMFMDGNGIPLAFNIFPGNQNEQPSMKPLEQKIIRDFGIEKLVVCTDAGLGSDDNRQFNDIGDRAFIVTQSLKKLKKDALESAMSDSNWRRVSDGEKVELSKIKAELEKYARELYYKEEPYGTKKVPGQIMYVTYSPKYAIYQREVRSRQIERAQKMVENRSKKKSYSNPNDPSRFVKKTEVTKDGEAADQTFYELDYSRIEEESRFDGYYAVCTNLTEDTVQDVLKVSEGRWEIEESFRIMKSEFKARPVHLSREDRIRAHFLTCYFSLLIYRLLEKKLEEKYTVHETVRALRKYRLLQIAGRGYIPEYTRTELTDALHNAFQFRTDTEIVPTSVMRKIIADTKSRKK